MGSRVDSTWASSGTLLYALEALEPRFLLSNSVMIDGTQPAALDQPQINAIFRTTPTGDPLGGTGPDDGIDVQAFLDTGTSGDLLSQETASALGITGTTFNGQDVQFTDVGIGGSEPFDVSGPIYGALAPYTSFYTTDLAVSAFDQTFGPARFELNPQPADELLGPIDIIGMPAIAGKVMVLDPSALTATNLDDLDSLRTYLYTPGTPFDAANASTDPGIPSTNFHVQMSYADFSGYTTTTPDGAPGPTLGDNPFIGPDPLSTSATSNVPPITITQGSASASGSFLFDTGSAASFISSDMAAQVGVYYQPGTYDSDNPVLVDGSGTPLPNQFVLPIGGIGGTVNAAGFYLSSLTLQTKEGEPVTFLNAPVLVADVSATNAAGNTITLDGDLGMNFLVPSLDVSGFSAPATSNANHAAASSASPADVTAGSDAPFDWITYDQTSDVLGLDIQGVTPSPLVSGISPSTGPAAGGTPVIITGLNFTGATAVTFGGTAASSFTINSPTQITAIAPAATAGAVDVQVTTSGGTSDTSTSDRFTYTTFVQAPTLVGSPVINGDNPNGLFNAAGQPAAGVQRSMVEDVVYTFSAPVTIANANAAFTVTGAGPTQERPRRP